MAQAAREKREEARKIRLEDGKRPPETKKGATGPKFAGNKIKTSRYTPLTFLPLNLWEQIHKFGNCYFLFISMLMYLGEKTTLFIGTIKYLSTLATLMAMMSVTALMAWLDDRRRDAADRETNNQQATACLGTNKNRNLKWEDVQVGDVLLVKQEQEFPADIVPLFCSGPDGGSYVSTANLDGETNLKPKAAPPDSQAMLTKEGNTEEKILARLEKLDVVVEAEAPKASIHDFEGRLIITLAAERQAEGNGEKVDEPLGPKNLLLRGTTLRNTEWCLGVVVYTGPQTRMVMNSREAPMKRSNIERVTNKVMIVVLAAQAVMALATDILFLMFREKFESYWYIQPPDVTLPDPIAYWLTFFVLYSNLMPISLYPTMEVCNAAQSYFIKNDKEMFYREEENDFQMAAGARSSTLCQELGQVSYVFSDKTGTLTRNVMELKRILIGGQTYGTLKDGEKGFNGGEAMAKARQEPKSGIDDFLEVLAVAHTVMVTKGADGRQKFEAESPDESALVEATAKLGWAFTGAAGQSRTVKVAEESAERQYSVVATNQFDSTRKRMSVVVKYKEDYILMCKGADNVMLDPKRSKAPAGFTDKLSEFAQEGLRTLVIARKSLDKAFVEKWLVEQQEAERQLGGRDEALAAVAEKIEVDMEVVGATAIEDKLQDQVPETIVLMRNAGIKIWVLTGDKLETARNIGFSSKVLTDEMHIATLDRTGDAKQVGENLKEFQQVGQQKVKDGVKLAMMVTGAALEVVQTQKLEKDFLGMGKLCSIVIACRVSPLQKAQMVRMVRQGVAKGSTPPVTLAVGDGANDVPMIQEAQVGVGIAGREGRQAMNNSDFSIAQFKHLQRLLFVHGRWNYRRVCKFTLFTFWRNAVQVLMIWYYTLFSGFSGTSLFEDWIRLSFNFLCSFPIMATGCFDQDIDQRQALERTELYVFGREGRDLNARKIGYTLLSACMHSFILEGITLFAFPHMDLKGVGDYYAFGTAVYTCLLVGMNYRVFFLNYTHNIYTLGAIAASFIFYALYLVVYPCFKPIADLLAPNMYMVPARLAVVAIFWLCIVMVPAIAMVMDMIIFSYHEHHDKENWQVSELRQQALEKLAQPEPAKPATQPQTQAGESQALLQSPQDDEAAKNFGLDLSDFAQQNLPVKFKPKRLFKNHAFNTGIIGAIMAVIIFVFGGITRLASHANEQIRIHYDGTVPTEDPFAEPWGTEKSEVTKVQDDCQAAAVGGATKTCTITVKVTRDMAPPVLVYYALGPFFQNHNNYLKSEVTKELMGQKVPDSLREKMCSDGTRVDGSGRDIIPCGMIATSVFNDTFEIAGHDIDTTDIAWPSDIERYRNPPDYGSSSGSWLKDRYPMLVHDEGVKNEQFAVWMRPSALWRVWNPYGHIRKGLKKGEELKVTIHSNYPVQSLGGYKQLVLTTTGWLGGRDDAFGDLLMFVGIVLVFLTAVCTCFMNRKEQERLREAQAAADAAAAPAGSTAGGAAGSAEVMGIS